MDSKKFLSYNLLGHTLGLVLIFMITFIFSGCSSLRPETDPLLDKKAIALSNKIRFFNQNIIASKGTGWVRIETKKEIKKFRIAWASIFPNKIRITFLVSGHPLETIIATGKTITFFSHTGEHSKYTYNSTNPNMEDYINVPVKMSEMVSLLLGRFPIKDFDDAWFSPLDSSLSTITLKKNWDSLTHLHFDNDEKLDTIQVKDSSGKLLYEMSIIKYKDYNFGTIPVKIQIKDKNSQKLTLEITSFTPNPKIKESVFHLTESG
jgi:outer membrane lipoprotein-sorting protein